MGLFNGVEKARSSLGGVFPEPGVYPVLNVSAIKMVPSRKGDELFCVEMEIVESNVPERPVGTTMSWMANLKHDAALGNIKGFIAALMNTPEDGIGEDDCDKMVDAEKQYGRNRLIRLEATNVKTRAKTDFTKCFWTGIPEEKQREAQQLRLEAGFL